MSTLSQRLAIAAKKAGANQNALATHLDISRAAVAKWFNDGSKNMKMEHLFSVADFLQVNARWLATGQGVMEIGRTSECIHSDIPHRRIDLIRMYGRLPDDVRQPIRALIESLAYWSHPSTPQYAKNVESVTRRLHDARGEYRTTKTTGLGS